MLIMGVGERGARVVSSALDAEARPKSCEKTTSCVGLSKPQIPALRVGVTNHDFDRIEKRSWDLFSGETPRFETHSFSQPLFPFCYLDPERAARSGGICGSSRVKQLISRGNRNHRNHVLVAYPSG
jgi:hypothetical protein